MTQQPQSIPSWSQKLSNTIESGIFKLARHWLTVFNVLVGTYVGLPFLAPVLMQLGLTGPARVIYTIYSPLCHQFGYRSWYLFGEQPFYMAPQFQQLTGIDPYTTVGRFAAKSFLGGEVIVNGEVVNMGWKVAYCERDVAIYAAILLAGIVYAIIRRYKPVKPAHLLFYGIVGIGPIALDGFSQLFSQPPLSLYTLRESTPFLRTLTGALFGLMNVWLAYPYIEESMDEIKADIARKRKHEGLST